MNNADYEAYQDEAQEFRKQRFFHAAIAAGFTEDQAEFLYQTR